ncbi:MAG: flagellar hook-length control protein FliK [Candidatus Sericytochromatia bacterium]|nr:flagellar hook-length control protein FliK [Candidatus Sericytochromatia bacterium]
MNPVPPLPPPQPKPPQVGPQDAENPDHARKVEEAREDREAVVRRPFLHYLAQWVPELMTDVLPAGVAETGEAAGAVAGLVLGQGRDEARGAESMEAWFQTPPPGAVPWSGQPVQPDLAPPDDTTVRGRPGLEVPALPGLVRAELLRARPGEPPATTLRFQLAPEHLGKLDLSFTYAQQKVSVTIVAQSQVAREQLAEKLGQIRDILHQHQLRTDKIEIAVEGKGRAATGQQDKDLGAGGPGSRLPRRRLRRPSNEGEDLVIS